jgi:hypothetical protein
MPPHFLFLPVYDTKEPLFVYLIKLKCLRRKFQPLKQLEIHVEAYRKTGWFFTI